MGDSEEAASVQQASASTLLGKIAGELEEQDVAAGAPPLLDLHNSFQRGSLLTALRLARTSDMLDVSGLVQLLVQRSVGMSQHAADQIAEQVFLAHGSQFTFEDLVCLLVPCQRVQVFEELVDSEVSMMRAAFAKLPGANGAGTAAATPELLQRAAREVPGLHPTGVLTKAESEAVYDKCLNQHDGALDVGSLFTVMREHQRETRAAPTQAQLVKAFGAFDVEKSSTLPLEKLKQVIMLFDGVELKPAVDDAKVLVGAEAAVKGSKSRPRFAVNIHTFVDACFAHQRHAQKAAEAAQQEAAGEKKFFFGWFGGGEKKATLRTPVVKPIMKPLSSVVAKQPGKVDAAVPASAGVDATSTVSQVI